MLFYSTCKSYASHIKQIITNEVWKRLRTCNCICNHYACMIYKRIQRKRHSNGIVERVMAALDIARRWCRYQKQENKKAGDVTRSFVKHLNVMLPGLGCAGRGFSSVCWNTGRLFKFASDLHSLKISVAYLPDVFSRVDSGKKRRKRRFAACSTCDCFSRVSSFLCNIALKQWSFKVWDLFINS